jgi:hypothetical protein
MSHDKEGAMAAGQSEAVVRLRISALSLGNAVRVGGEDGRHVRALAEADTPLPPILVHRQTMTVIDGMHRVRAALMRGEQCIDARYFVGDEREAFVLAVELNSRHGLPLTQDDRTAAATRVLATHPHWSDRAIAALAGLSAKTVAGIRRRISEDIPQSNVRTGRDGSIRPLNTAHGRRLAGELMAQNPGASLRDIARQAGISLGTARDVRLRLAAGHDVVPPRQRERESRAGGASSRPPAPRSPTELPPTRPCPPVDPVELAKLLESLKKDPSIRFSENGRALLRLLDLMALPDDGVPSHCGAAIVAAARRISGSWEEFADLVERRYAESRAL